MSAANRGDINTGALAKAFERLDEHHADIAGIKSDMAGVKKDVGTLVGIVGNLGSDIKQLSHAVTNQVASRGPSWMEMLGAALTLALFVGALTAGIGVYLDSRQGGPMSDLQVRMQRAEAALATRESEDRAELTRRREEDRIAFGARLRSLETRAAAVTPP